METANNRELTSLSLARLEKYKGVPLADEEQSALICLGLEQIPESEYKLLGFSEVFKAEYGSPLKSYYDFVGFMQTEIYIKIPKYKQLFPDFVNQVSYTSFCDGIDGGSRRHGYIVADRHQMEAASIQILFRKFDEITPDLLRSLIGHLPWVTNELSAKASMKEQLSKAVERRSTPDVLKYWSEKPAKFGLPGLYIKALDGSGDPVVAPGSKELEEVLENSEEPMEVGGEEGGIVEQMEEMELESGYEHLSHEQLVAVYRDSLRNRGGEGC